MKNDSAMLKSFLMVLFVLSIPSFLAIEALQSNKFVTLENEVRALENSQNEAIDSNKQLISELGTLSSSARIEKIAIEELGMHQATSDEIVRVEMRSSNNTE